MASQVTFDEWFATECKGLSFEARRLMQISWNAALTNGDQHFFVAELAETINYTDCKNATWSKLLDEVRRKENCAQSARHAKPLLQAGTRRIR